MRYRVAVIGSLLIGLASFSFAQADAASTRGFDSNQLTRPANGGETVGAILTGTVRRQDDQGVSNARIEVRELTGMVAASAYSGPNGSFQINGLRAGRYEIVATVGIAEAHTQLALDRGENSISLRVSERGNTSAQAGGSAKSVSLAEMQVPEKARKALTKYRELLAKKREKEADKELARALEIYPHYAEALRERGIMNFANGRVDDAVNDLTSAIKYDPSNGMAYVALGAAFNNTEKYDDAQRALERGVALVPDAWQAHFELARTELAKGDYAGSLRSIDKAQQFLKDEYLPMHLVKAHALLGLKNYTEAQNELEAFLTRDPNGVDSAQVRHTLDEVKSFTARGGNGK
jgi:tetratricopeptide (TPR) repeat protein